MPVYLFPFNFVEFQNTLGFFPHIPYKIYRLFFTSPMGFCLKLELVPFGIESSLWLLQSILTRRVSDFFSFQDLVLFLFLICCNCFEIYLYYFLPDGVLNISLSLAFFTTSLFFFQNVFSSEIKCLVIVLGFCCCCCCF